MSDSKKITDLDENAQDKAIKDFIDFYLRMFKKDDLEIISMYKVDYFLTDINSFIMENSSFTPEQIREALFTRVRKDLMKVISVINPGYYDNGNFIDSSWDEWNHKKFVKLGTRD